MNEKEKTEGPNISIVIPLYNEEPNVVPLCREIQEVMAENELDYELILVDDGSDDDTLAKAREWMETQGLGMLVELRRNYGQAAAMGCGFDHATADIVVAMDGDRQNDPRDIEKLVWKLREGYDVVSGWRRERRDNWTRIFPSVCANQLISLITGVKLHDYGCTLKAYRRKILDEITVYGETHRFIPALIKWAGGRITEMSVNHRPRTEGKSKYGFDRVGRVLLDLVTVKFLMDYLTTPLYFFGKIGFFSILMALTSLAVVIIQKVGHGANMTGNPLLYLSVTLVILAAQFVSMGLITEVLVRTYHESQDRKTYAVREKHEPGD